MMLIRMKLVTSGCQSVRRLATLATTSNLSQAQPDPASYSRRNSNYSTILNYNQLDAHFNCHKLPSNYYGSFFDYRIQKRHFRTSRALHKEIVAFKLSDIGEGISEVVIKEWYVKVGDHVSQFDRICEVQSDKASVTITSRYDGKIAKLYHEMDETAKVGSPLVDIELESDSQSTVSEKDELPSVESQVGATVETDVSSTLKFERPTQTKEADNGTRVEIKEVEKSRTTIVDTSAFGHTDKVLTTPAVRRIAMEHGIDLRQVQGTGKDGRVLKEDVLAYVEGKGSMPTMDQAKQIKPPSITQAQATPKMKQPVTQQFEGEERIEPIRGIRKGMTKTMTEALKIPHFGVADEVTLNNLIELQKRYAQTAIQMANRSGAQEQDQPLKISLMPFFVKAASIALTNYPILNSSLDSTGENIIYKRSHNIGIAIDTPHGLVVPNIKNVQQLTILEINQEIHRLRQLAITSQLSSNDLAGQTFSLSNIGSVGGLFGIPVIFPPAVSIGAIGRIRTLPRFKETSSNDHRDAVEQIYKAKVINVLWTADHRIIDGATMTRFNNLWKQLIEDPMKLLLHLK